MTKMVTDRTASEAATASGQHSRPRLAARLARCIVRRVCEQLTDVPFRITYWDGTSDRFGDGPPAFQLTLRDPAVVWRILRAPDPAFGEAYMAGTVEVDGLDQMLDALHGTPFPLLARLRLPQLTPRATPVSHQYRDIQAHYDRSNAFFALWLDASRTYSCAYFRREDNDLEAAQAAKIDYVLRKAQLQPGQSLLDIGSGWGALILRAAQCSGVRAHGITLSQQQYEYTVDRIRATGLQAQVSADLLDYRELATKAVTFDRVVSVGMLEHVGRRNLRAFLQAVKRLLKPGGVCVLHTITQAMEEEIGPWTQRYIFPGGYIPAWREVVALLPDYGFRLIDAESLRRHYALTLSHWALRFEERLPEVRSLGFDETFIRMWRLYLQSAAAGFRNGSLDLHQFVFTHGVNNGLPLTREHLYQEEEGEWECPNEP